MNLGKISDKNEREENMEMRDKYYKDPSWDGSPWPYENDDDYPTKGVRTFNTFTKF